MVYIQTSFKLLSKFSKANIFSRPLKISIFNHVHLFSRQGAMAVRTGGKSRGTKVEDTDPRAIRALSYRRARVSR